MKQKPLFSQVYTLIQIHLLNYIIIKYLSVSKCIVKKYNRYKRYTNTYLMATIPIPYPLETVSFIYVTDTYRYTYGPIYQCIKALYPYRTDTVDTPRYTPIHTPTLIKS